MEARFEEYIYDTNYSLFDLSFVASLLEDRIQFSLTYNLFDLIQSDNGERYIIS